jgi:hypothetical protein
MCSQAARASERLRHVASDIAHGGRSQILVQGEEPTLAAPRVQRPCWSCPQSNGAGVCDQGAEVTPPRRTG